MITLGRRQLSHADDAGAQREHQGVSHYLGEVRRGEGVRVITASRAGDHQVCVCVCGALRNRAPALQRFLLEHLQCSFHRAGFPFQAGSVQAGFDVLMPPAMQRLGGFQFDTIRQFFHSGRDVGWGLQGVSVSVWFPISS